MHTTLNERQLRSLTTLENYLLTHTFLVGERLTLADLTMASYIKRAVSITIDAPLRAKLPNIIRHLETVVNQPKVKDIYGEIEYAEKALTFVPPAKEKKAKPAAAAPPAAEAKKPKAKPEPQDDDDDESLVPEEPKAKNPLDSLPKSTFNLEDWKRAYSNKETRGPGGALEWFYQKSVCLRAYFNASSDELLHDVASTKKASPFGALISNTTASSLKYSCPPIKSVVSLTGSKLPENTSSVPSVS
jgi:elongation factor 1-gamma